MILPKAKTGIAQPFARSKPFSFCYFRRHLLAIPDTTAKRGKSLYHCWLKHLQVIYEPISCNIYLPLQRYEQSLIEWQVPEQCRQWICWEPLWEMSASLYLAWRAALLSGNSAVMWIAMVLQLTHLMNVFPACVCMFVSHICTGVCASPCALNISRTADWIRLAWIRYTVILSAAWRLCRA